MTRRRDPLSHKPALGSRRLYAEHVPIRELQDPSLLRALARRRVELAVAIFPADRPRAADLDRACRAAGVALVLWPLLDDTLGRWPSAANAEAFGHHALALSEALRTRNARGAWSRTMLLDIEPPIRWMRRALHGRILSPPEPFQRESLLPVAHGLRERGHVVEAVAPPMVAFGRRWETWLGTPVSELGCGRVEPMAYTSLFEGYSKGIVDRGVARDLLRRIALLQPDALSLGVVGGGALGDERAYRGVEELREDVAIATDCGVRHLSLYSLDGILQRPPLERWLDAFTAVPSPTPAPRRTRPTRRGALLVALASLLGRPYAR